MLKSITANLFLQIENALQLITNDCYKSKNELMCNATIGQHVRHIIELFEEMIKGYGIGKINYENRQRNFLIENDISFAITQMKIILNEIDKPNLKIILVTSYDDNNDTAFEIETNYFREIIYNIEHTIHHMALIRIAFKSSFNIELNNEFGVAPSTLKYKQQCAQ